MLKLKLVIIFLIVLPCISFAAENIFIGGDTSVLIFENTTLLNQTSWYFKAGSTIDSNGVASHNGDITSLTSIFGAEYFSSSSQPLLLDEYNQYFIVVYPNKTPFKVTYYDQYDVLPDAGYPKARYWNIADPSAVSSQVMAQTSASGANIM